MPEVLWPLEPHTVGKHLVLRQYLNAWLPILGSRSGRILFIDGFAGPGEYSTGEEGSPLIALKTLAEHSAKQIITAEVNFLFIESDAKRADHLRSVIRTRGLMLPPRCKVEVIHGSFDGAMTRVLDELDQQAKRMAPAFVMVDPFGISGTPMSVIRRILANPISEVYISFMYEFINRFKVTTEFSQHLDALFGCSEWRDGHSIENADARKDFMYRLYESQLKKAGAEQVVKFELWHENRLVYAIFFATKHKRGCDLMKQAVWKVAPIGTYAFHGTKSRQLLLGIERPDFEPLKAALVEEFADKGWVKIEAMIDFVCSDRIEYHSSQLKGNALKPMEEADEIEVDPTSRRRRGTYPGGTRLRFRPRKLV